MRLEVIKVLLLPKDVQHERVKKRTFPFVNPAAFSSWFAAIVYTSKGAKGLYPEKKKKRVSSDSALMARGYPVNHTLTDKLE